MLILIRLEDECEGMAALFAACEMTTPTDEHEGHLLRPPLASV